MAKVWFRITQIVFLYILTLIWENWKLENYDKVELINNLYILLFYSLPWSPPPWQWLLFGHWRNVRRRARRAVIDKVRDCANWNDSALEYRLVERFNKPRIRTYYVLIFQRPADSTIPCASLSVGPGQTRSRRSRHRLGFAAFSAAVFSTRRSSCSAQIGSLCAKYNL